MGIFFKQISTIQNLTIKVFLNFLKVKDIIEMFEISSYIFLKKYKVKGTFYNLTFIYLDESSETVFPKSKPMKKTLNEALNISLIKRKIKTK